MVTVLNKLADHLGLFDGSGKIARRRLAMTAEWSAFGFQRIQDKVSRCALVVFRSRCLGLFSSARSAEIPLASSGSSMKMRAIHRAFIGSSVICQNLQSRATCGSVNIL
jgi:hypothetical protein